jgi:hypothetical protein
MYTISIVIPPVVLELPEHTGRKDLEVTATIDSPDLSDRLGSAAPPRVLK